MSQAWKQAKRAVGQSGGPESKALDFETFPELSAFLGGVATPDGKGFDLAPHTATLWIEGDMVFFCLQSKQEANKLFGSFQSLNQGFDGVERALSEGKFSTRVRKA